MKILRTGFTLVELVVVIAVLAILAGIALPRFINSMEAARGSKIIADMQACESAVNIYYAKNGFFPDNTDSLVEKYLAVWPKPPTGKASIKKNDRSELQLDLQATDYVYTKPAGTSELAVSLGRITLGAKSLNDLLTATETSLTLTD